MGWQLAGRESLPLPELEMRIEETLRRDKRGWAVICVASKPPYIEATSSGRARQ